MNYIEALNLINLSISHNILKEYDKEHVYVYVSDKTAKNGSRLVIVTKDSLAKELKNDKLGQKLLKEALCKLGVKNVESFYKNI